jgi:hypothetical protein
MREWNGDLRERQGPVLGVEASREPIPKVQSVPEETHSVLRTG